MGWTELSHRDLAATGLQCRPYDRHLVWIPSRDPPVNGRAGRAGQIRFGRVTVKHEGSVETAADELAVDVAVPAGHSSITVSIWQLLPDPAASISLGRGSGRWQALVEKPHSDHARPRQREPILGTLGRRISGLYSLPRAALTAPRRRWTSGRLLDSSTIVGHRFGWNLTPPPKLFEFRPKSCEFSRHERHASH